MKTKLITIAAAAASVSALLSMSAVALGANAVPEILVQAGPATKTVVGRDFGTGAPIEAVTVDYHVSYADLDLVKHADVVTLNKRVESAAQDACRQLDKLFPLERPKMHECMTDAVNAAADQVQFAISMAESHSK